MPVCRLQCHSSFVVCDFRAKSADVQVLAERMDYWNHDPSADAINRVRGAVADVKSVMIENIEKARAHDAPSNRLMRLHRSGLGSQQLSYHMLQT
jgi:hypothetical protein